MRVDELQRTEHVGVTGLPSAGQHRVVTGCSHVPAVVSKPVNLSGLEVVQIELLNTLRMRNIYAFIFVSARYQIYIFGPLKLIIMLPHTKTALRDKGSGRGRVRAGEREGTL